MGGSGEPRDGGRVGPTSAYLRVPTGDRVSPARPGEAISRIVPHRSTRSIRVPRMLCFGSLLELFTLCRSLQQAKLLTDFPFLCRVHMDNHRSAKHTRQNLHDGVLDSYIFNSYPHDRKGGTCCSFDQLLAERFNFQGNMKILSPTMILLQYGSLQVPSNPENTDISFLPPPSRHTTTHRFVRDCCTAAVFITT